MSEYVCNVNGFSRAPLMRTAGIPGLLHSCYAFTEMSNTGVCVCVCVCVCVWLQSFINFSYYSPSYLLDFHSYAPSSPAPIPPREGDRDENRT